MIEVPPSSPLDEKLTQIYNLVADISLGIVLGVGAIVFGLAVLAHNSLNRKKEDK